MRKIKNYTSGIAADKSRAAIQKALIELGATNVSIEAADGAVTGMSFSVQIGPDLFRYRLPARVEAVEKLLKPKRIRKDNIYKDQAERTAWKLLRDWVEVQAALIKIGMSSATEVFLPYMIVGKGRGSTLWANLSSRHGGLLAITDGQGALFGGVEKDSRERAGETTACGDDAAGAEGSEILAGQSRSAGRES